MAVFNPGGSTAASIITVTRQKLLALRTALEGVADLYIWSSGLSAADLEAVGFSAGDAATLQSALADADAIAQIYQTGLPPSTYPQPSSAYVYGASQRQVIGAQ